MFYLHTRMRFYLSRQSVAVVLLCAQVFASFGIPLPSFGQSTEKDRSRPYPCMSRSCSCSSYEQFWAGACCCYTMQEKIAWAEAHGETPPSNAFAIADEERRALAQKQASKAPASCCAAEPACCKSSQPKPAHDCQSCKAEKSSPQPVPSTKAPSIRWVTGVAALQCHGMTSDVLKEAPGLVPVAAAQFEQDLPFVHLLLMSKERTPKTVSLPSVPPPRFHS